MISRIINKQNIIVAFCNSTQLNSTQLNSTQLNSNLNSFKILASLFDVLKNRLHSISLNARNYLNYAFSYAFKLEIISHNKNLKSVWAIADTFNGLMAIPNLIGVILLSPIVITMVKKYLKNPTSVELEY